MRKPTRGFEMPSNQVPLFPEPAKVHCLVQDLPTEEIPGRKVSAVESLADLPTEETEREPDWKSLVRKLRAEMEAQVLAAADEDHARLMPGDVRTEKAGQIMVEVLRHVSKAESYEVVGLEAAVRGHDWNKFDDWLEKILARYGNSAESSKKKSA